MKNLRNKVAHSDFPVLEEYDPDNPRTQEDLLKLLKKEIYIKEAYQYSFQFKNPKYKTVFIPGDYNIKTLKNIRVEDCFALHQFLLAIDIIKEINLINQKLN